MSSYVRGFKVLRVAMSVVVFLLAAARVHAIDTFWSNSRGDGSGTFSSATNWSPSVPGPNDVAHFGMTTSSLDPKTYTVSFTVGASNQGLVVEDDRVTFDLSGGSYGTRDNTIGTVSGRTGRLTIINGNWFGNGLTGGTLRIGEVVNATGVLNVSTGATVIRERINVGNFGPGTLLILNGGSVTSTVTSIGVESPGAATVTGTNSILSLETLSVGGRNTGTLNISAGGKVQNSGGGIVGDLLGSSGTVNVDGANSSWTNSGTVDVGRFGEAIVNITGGAHATFALINIGPVTIPSTAFGAGMGKVTVSGVSSQLSGAITIGGRGNGSGTGEFEVSEGGLVQCTGTNLRIAPGGEGKVSVTTGGRIEAVNSQVGIGLTGPGVAIASVSGAGSQWINTGNLEVGFSTQGTLTISDGGLFQNVNGDIGNTVLSDAGVGTVTVTGAATEWRNTGTLTVGKAGPGTLNISDHGLVRSSNGFVGSLAGGMGVVMVSGAGTEWQDFGTLTVGGAGTGTLNISAGGVVRSDGGFVGSLAGSLGAVNIDGFGSRWISSTDISIGPAGNGSVTVTNEGAVQAQNVKVESNGSLGGNGTIISDVQNSGLVAPGASIGMLEVNGDFKQQSSGVLEIEIGGSSASHVDLLRVGAATLDGELRLKLIAGVVPAINVALVAAGLSGQFDNVANGQRLSTVDGGGSFVVNYGPGSPFNPNQLVLSAFQPTALPGDYNQSGTVDAADYVIWRKSIGSGTSLPNDDTPGVGPDDYNRWRSHFGQSTGSGAVMLSNAVPETSAPALLLVTAVAMSWVRCSKRLLISILIRA